MGCRAIEMSRNWVVAHMGCRAVTVGSWKIENFIPMYAQFYHATIFPPSVR